MEVGETKPGSGYNKPPWIFKGSALYQLHLVKAETARAFIPKEFRLVEAFGYTLGGFFLANYDDSPAGIFDELVVLAGIVWNPPTSCAWAARVLVNSDEACAHGRKEIGLPSQVAKFSKRITTVSSKRQGKISGPLNMIGIGTTFSSPRDSMNIQVTENRNFGAADFCNINLMTAVPESKIDKWMGPAIKISLPNFSGRTECNPNLLKYSCKLECRVRVVKPAKVYGPSSPPKDDRVQSSEEQRMNSLDSRTGEIIADEQNLSVSVMLSKPVLALEFSCLRMQVEEPLVVSNCSKVSVKDS